MQPGLLFAVSVSADDCTVQMLDPVASGSIVMPAPWARVLGERLLALAPSADPVPAPSQMQLEQVAWLNSPSVQDRLFNLLRWNPPAIQRVIGCEPR